MLRERESERQTHRASEVGGGVERKGEEKEEEWLCLEFLQ
jgi:hypothetical protein